MYHLAARQYSILGLANLSYNDVGQAIANHVETFPLHAILLVRLICDLGCCLVATRRGLTLWCFTLGVMVTLSVGCGSCGSLSSFLRFPSLGLVERVYCLAS